MVHWSLSLENGFLSLLSLGSFSLFSFLVSDKRIRVLKQ